MTKYSFPCRTIKKVAERVNFFFGQLSVVGLLLTMSLQVSGGIMCEIYTLGYLARRYPVLTILFLWTFNIKNPDFYLP